mmetsp:Transcript_15407/g.39093  ORF Transcript_15407/g.39093 Transcript_15407/m.39093 type:complete len:99 (+) Transcript_15407:64-360(+)
MQLSSMRLLLAVASLAALQLAAAPAPPSCLLRAGRSIRLSAMGPSAPEMHSELAQAREAAIAALRLQLLPPMPPPASLPSTSPTIPVALPPPPPPPPP